MIFDLKKVANGPPGWMSQALTYLRRRRNAAKPKGQLPESEAKADAGPVADTPGGAAVRPPEIAGEHLVFVIDDEAAICNFLGKTLSTLGIESETFHNAKDALAAFERRSPRIIFLDVTLMQSDAIDVVRGLGEKRFGGIVYLMSGGNRLLLDAVQRIGLRKGLMFGTPLHKPFRRDDIVTLLAATAPASPAG